MNQDLSEKQGSEIIDDMQSFPDLSFWRGDILIAEQQPLSTGQDGTRNNNINLLPHYC